MIISGRINFTIGIALESSRKKAPSLYNMRFHNTVYCFVVIFPGLYDIRADMNMC